MRNFENNEGRKVWITEVVADNVRFLESANKSNGNTSGGGGYGGDPFYDDGKPVDISDDDIPF